MPQFNLAMPEEQDFTLIQNLRRTQLLRLAKAFDIPHPPNCGKTKLLPLLDIYIHVKDGLIKAKDGTEPKYPEFLLAPGDRPGRVAARAAAAVVAKRHKHIKKKYTESQKHSKEIMDSPFGNEYEATRAVATPVFGLVAKWRGGAKWCVMDGDEVVQSGLSKEDAIAACG